MLNLQSKLKEFAQTFDIPLKAVYGGLIFIVSFTSLVFAMAAVQDNQELRKKAARFETKCGWCGNTCINMAGEIDLRCPDVEPPPGCICKKNGQGVCQSSCNDPKPSITTKTPTPTQTPAKKCGDGICDPDETVNNCPGDCDCATEGGVTIMGDPTQTINSCCDTISSVDNQTKLQPINHSQPPCDGPQVGAMICTFCGDGQCGTGENICNCPQDCPEPTAEVTPTLDPAISECRQGGGEWRQFPNGCVDSCNYAANPGVMCTQALTYGCDCGPDQCWSGDICVDNPNPTDPPPQPTICESFSADFNDDCTVDHADYYILLNELYSDNPNQEQDIASEYNHEAVSQPDGKVDIWDYTMLIKQWRQSQN